MDFIIFLIACGVAFFTGSIAEKKHYQSIRTREAKIDFIPMITVDESELCDGMQRAEMVVGGVVVSCDFFKTTIAGLVTVFGGNISAIESVIDRARREATLRMQEQAQGADMLANVRLQTSTVGPFQVEAIAYATALYK